MKDAVVIVGASRAELADSFINFVSVEVADQDLAEHGPAFPRFFFLLDRHLPAFLKRSTSLSAFCLIFGSAC